MFYFHIFLFVLFGGFIAAGIWIIFDSLKTIRQCTGETIGTVVDIDQKWEYVGTRNRRRNMLVYYPVVEFSAGGVTRRINGSKSQDENKYKTGMTMNVKYCPDDPKKAFIADGTEGEIVTFGAGVIATGVLGIFLTLKQM